MAPTHRPNRAPAKPLGTLVGAALTLAAAAATGVAMAQMQPAQPPPSTREVLVATSPNAPPASMSGARADGRLIGLEVSRSRPLQPLLRDTEHEHRRAGGYSLLQMNLCLSGFASCFQRYPKVVDEAIGLIGSRPVDAVTLNEACSRDVARIARTTGYHLRFAPVLHDGRSLKCVRPGNRGVFGNAVMTQAAIDSARQEAFTAQAGTEERRWICVDTVREVNVCTTHLGTRGADAARAANDRQCSEFAAVLARRHQRGPLIAAGDINRPDPCAPPGLWARTDAYASQLPGRQHTYGGTRDFQPLEQELVPAAHTDHAFLLVGTRLLPRD